ncbi:MAG: hypothetical protein KDD03_01005, partial [Gelidibacter sp.]|nr:hypothetical protein [Gelidibacter sp.]
MFEPRLESSQKHTPQPLPKDLALIVKESLLEKYADFFNNKVLSVEGAIYPDELVVLVGFKNQDSIRQFNFECSIDYNSSDGHDDETIRKDDAVKKLYFAFEAIDS